MCANVLLRRAYEWSITRFLSEKQFANAYQVIGHLTMVKSDDFWVAKRYTYIIWHGRSWNVVDCHGVVVPRRSGWNRADSGRQFDIREGEVSKIPKRNTITGVPLRRLKTMRRQDRLFIQLCNGGRTRREYMFHYPERYWLDVWFWLDWVPGDL